MAVSRETMRENTFMVCVSDVLSYTLRYNSIEWSMPSPYSNHRRVFHVVFGNAVYWFRERHKDEFFERICEHGAPIFDTIEDFLDFVDVSVARIFKGKVFLMEIIVYCSFLTDLAIFCHLNDKEDLVYHAMDSTSAVWINHVRPYFDIVGGWYALYRVAEQYLEFILLRKQYADRVREESCAVAKGSESEKSSDKAGENEQKDSSNIAQSERKESSNVAQSERKESSNIAQSERKESSNIVERSEQEDSSVTLETSERKQSGVAESEPKESNI